MKKYLKDKIKNSGNNLHIWVADTLKRLRWDINLGSYYYDDTLPKPREIDIIAKHRVDSSQGTKISIDKQFDVNLFIECKHFLSDIAFRQYETSEEDREKAILIERFAVLESLNYKAKGHIEKAILSIHPYYNKEKIGKLYDTTNKNKDRGQDLLFDSITQPIKSYIFNEPYLSQGVSFLIVVYENIKGIYELEGQDYSDSFLDGLTPNKASTLGVKYSYREQISGDIQQNRNFFIDFIHKDELENYLQKNVMPVVNSLAFAMTKI